MTEGRHPTTGRWVKGVGGTGRRHRIDLLSVCDRLAREEGRSLEALLWGVVKGLIVAAGQGDHQAAKLLFYHFVKDDGKGTPQPAAALAVNIDARPTGAGPAMPTAQAFAEYLEGLGEFADELRRAQPNLLTVEPASPLDELLS